MRLKLLSQHGALSPGVYTFSGKLANYLMRTGKAVPFVKEEKKVLVTKEEKFIPETKDYSGVPISKLDVSQITTEDLQVIADTDARVTAKRMAKEELKNR